MSATDRFGWGELEPKLPKPVVAESLRTQLDRLNVELSGDAYEVLEADESEGLSIHDLAVAIAEAQRARVEAALSAARQQGRDEAAEAIEAERDRRVVLGIQNGVKAVHENAMSAHFNEAARVARGVGETP